VHDFSTAENLLQKAYDNELESGMDFTDLVGEVGPMAIHIVFDALYKELRETIRNNPEGQLAQIMSVVADQRAMELYSDHDLTFFRSKYGLER
jgi:hypothetical protein